MSDPRQTVQLLWGTSEPSKRGPRPSLTTSQIVDTAIRLADAEGLAALSMHRVAKELGVTAMSIYRYIPSKDDLYELVFDTAVGQPPPLSGENWRERFLAFGRAEKAMYRDRPWLLDVPLSGPPIGPNNMLWMNAGLDALTDSGLHEAEKLYALLLMSIYVRGESQLGFNIAQSEQRTGVSEAARDQVWAEVLRDVADNPQYAALGRLVNSGILDVPVEDVELSDADFEFGLHRILDGIAALTYDAQNGE